MGKRVAFMWVSLLAALAAVVFLLVGVSVGSTGEVSGVVVDAQGPLSGATVRQRATENSTVTDRDGRFRLDSLVEGQEVEVTAWADGYYIAGTHVTPTVSGLTLTLRRYHTEDHPDYVWTSPISGSSPGACGNCHPMIISQWQKNAHGQAISSPRFFSFYNGSNLSGTQESGPGYQLDFPGTAGSCANCHAPGAGVDGFLTTNMNDVRDGVTDGIHCDYCHKIGGVYLNRATGSVYPNAPGAQSQRLLRPPAGDNIFFGPFDDIPDPDTFLPLIREGQYCAPCHQFSFWGTPIYESFEEWLTSPYAEAGVSCQSCHMPPDGVSNYFALPEKGGLYHPADSIPSHFQLGANSVELLQNTVTMSVVTRQIVDRLEVTVTITNTGAGHHVPTDFPGRQMILVVTAGDEGGQALSLSDGPTVPAWGGDQAGQPGLGFAKVLRDVASDEAPVVSYWKQTLIDSDSRLPALATRRASYSFHVPEGSREVQVTSRLLFRRLFQETADEKGWRSPDIDMELERLIVPLRPTFQSYLPLAVHGR